MVPRTNTMCENEIAPLTNNAGSARVDVLDTTPTLCYYYFGISMGKPIQTFKKNNNKI